ncbi:GyrI-like domain-containing protein, partial [Tenacibaculum discolor]|uniref:GyrI-like domain-containing protein n=1 Tax=Tenacibaculum discolor TaxID=361581 RepID=UPI0013DEA59A
YHDDPNITDISKMRQSACIELQQDVKVSGEVNKMTLKEGNYAVGKYEIDFSEFGNAPLALGGRLSH